MNTETELTCEEMLMELAVEAVLWKGRDATKADIEIDDQTVVAFLRMNGSIATILMFCNQSTRLELQELLCQVMHGGVQSEKAGRELAKIGAPIARQIIQRQAARYLPDAVTKCIAKGTLGRWRKLTETGELK